MVLLQHVGLLFWVVQEADTAAIHPLKPNKHIFTLTFELQSALRHASSAMGAMAMHLRDNHTLRMLDLKLCVSSRLKRSLRGPKWLHIHFRLCSQVGSPLFGCQMKIPDIEPLSECELLRADSWLGRFIRFGDSWLRICSGLSEDYSRSCQTSI